MTEAETILHGWVYVLDDTNDAGITRLLVNPTDLRMYCRHILGSEWVPGTTLKLHGATLIPTKKLDAYECAVVIGENGLNRSQEKT